jgi:hypothetical protein
MLAADYGVTKNILIGARVGIIFFTYPGGSPNLGANGSVNAAIRDGRTSSFGRFHGELRGTYLFGKDPLARSGIAPMVFAGGGISEFDAHGVDNVALYQPPPSTAPPQVGKVNIWRTDGPGFLLLGGGARWQFGESVAATLGIRLNIAFGGSGVIPTFGPELGLQYGF